LPADKGRGGWEKKKKEGEGEKKKKNTTADSDRDGITSTFPTPAPRSKPRAHRAPNLRENQKKGGWENRNETWVLSGAGVSFLFYASRESASPLVSVGGRKREVEKKKGGGEKKGRPGGA